MFLTHGWTAAYSVISSTARAKTYICLAWDKAVWLSTGISKRAQGSVMNHEGTCSFLHSSSQEPLHATVGWRLQQSFIFLAGLWWVRMDNHQLALIGSSQRTAFMVFAQGSETLELEPPRARARPFQGEEMASWPSTNTWTAGTWGYWFGTSVKDNSKTRTCIQYVLLPIHLHLHFHEQIHIKRKIPMPNTYAKQFTKYTDMHLRNCCMRLCMHLRNCYMHLYIHWIGMSYVYITFHRPNAGSSEKYARQSPKSFPNAWPDCKRIYSI